QICRVCIPLIRSCDCQIYQYALSSLASSTLAPNSLRYLLGLAQRLSISIVRVSCCLTMTALFLMRSPVRQSSGGRWSLIEPCIQLSRPEIDCGSMLAPPRSEEHTSELQSRFDLVCRLLLEKKKKQTCRTNSSCTVALRRYTA